MAFSMQSTPTIPHRRKFYTSKSCLYSLIIFEKKLGIYRCPPLVFPEISRKGGGYLSRYMVIGKHSPSNLRCHQGFWNKNGAHSGGGLAFFFLLGGGAWGGGGRQILGGWSKTWSSKKFSPAAGIDAPGLFCWRNSSKSPKVSQARLSFVLGTWLF